MIYIIKNESIESNAEEVQILYNDSSSKKPYYSYSYYKYDTRFIGYVVNTSIETMSELNQSYRINSENFSSKSSTSDVYSEYYIYLLIDPFLTSSDEINKLFEKI